MEMCTDSDELICIRKNSPLYVMDANSTFVKDFNTDTNKQMFFIHLNMVFITVTNSPTHFNDIDTNEQYL